ncbi:MAG: hypothetical protein D3924_01910, partial [Candidatus Electrothrix sp. AR4]|nr:hypothetical protein [Candidatus Electrothrix sp. AR4]
QNLWGNSIISNDVRNTTVQMAALDLGVAPGTSLKEGQENLYSFRLFGRATRVINGVPVGTGKTIEIGYMKRY